MRLEIGKRYKVRNDTNIKHVFIKGFKADSKTVYYGDMVYTNLEIIPYVYDWDSDGTCNMLNWNDELDGEWDLVEELD